MAIREKFTLHTPNPRDGIYPLPPSQGVGISSLKAHDSFTVKRLAGPSKRDDRNEIGFGFGFVCTFSFNFWGKFIMLTTFKQFLQDEEGAAAIEYALIAALIAMAIVVGATALGGGINSFFSAIATDLAAIVASM
jgi:pilus assembly protein Flp/PilA